MTQQIDLRPQLFINASAAAATSSWIPIDYRFSGIQQRSISGTRANTDDEVLIELRTTVIVSGVSHSVIATATAFTSANGAANSVVIQGPANEIRVRKVGVSGSALFVGVV